MCAQDHPDGVAGPVLAVLAADPRLWLPVTFHCSALHAGVQSHVLSALHTRQHFPGEEYPQLNANNPYKHHHIDNENIQCCRILYYTPTANVLICET